MPSWDLTSAPSGAFAPSPFDVAHPFTKLVVVLITSLVAVAKVVK